MKGAKRSRSKGCVIWALKKYPPVGTKCEVEFDGEWIPGEIVGYCHGDYREDFFRVNVRSSWRLWEGCSPMCVRVKGKELMDGPF